MGMIFHKQCTICQAIAEGPAKGQNPGHHVEHISDTGDYMQAEPDAEHPFNVSHGICDNPQCEREYERQYFPKIYAQHEAEREREQKAQREEEAARRREERKQQRRMRRGRKDEA